MVLVGVVSQWCNSTDSTCDHPLFDVVSRVQNAAQFGRGPSLIAINRFPIAALTNAGCAANGGYLAASVG